MEFSYSKNGIVVPDGHVWLQGDNESNSTDSRHYGPVPEALVKGIVIARIWPPKDVGRISDRVEKMTRKSVVRTDAKQYAYNMRMKQEAKRQKKLEDKERERKEAAVAKQVIIENNLNHENRRRNQENCAEKDGSGNDDGVYNIESDGSVV
jgi:hypothetical protein